MKHKSTHIVSEILIFASQRKYRFFLSELKGFLEKRNEDVPSDSTLYRILKQLAEDGWISHWNDSRQWMLTDRLRDIEIKE
jgi:DNA-binding PadR family transcriptional regulator